MMMARLHASFFKKNENFHQFLILKMIIIITLVEGRQIVERRDVVPPNHFGHNFDLFDIFHRSAQARQIPGR